MAAYAWIACLVVVAASLASAALGLRAGLRAGRWPDARRRLRSPTPWLFTAYLVVAGLVSPTAPGESASPLLGLAVVLPAGYALATLASMAPPRGVAARVARALLHAAAVGAAAAIVLALASPAFVPRWLR